MIDETFAAANRPWEGRSVGEVARRTGPRAVRRPPRRGAGRPPPHRPAAPHPGLRGRLAGPRRGLGGPPGGGRRFRCRRPPRHHVRCRLLDLVARRGGAPPPAPQLGGGGPPADRRAGPPLRAEGPRDASPRATGPTWWSSTPTPWGAGPERTRDDLPGGASRLYAESTGVAHVLVNGTEVVGPDGFTGDLPGQRPAFGPRHPDRDRRHRVVRVISGGRAPRG